MITNLIGACGTAMTLVENLPMLLIGRVIFGTAVGIQAVCMPRYVDEIVPLRRYNVCIACYVLSINIGYVFALCSAVLLPPDTDV